VGRQQAPVQKAQAKLEILWKAEEILMEDKMLTSKCLAKRINVHPVTVRNWRAKGKGPRYMKNGPQAQGLVRYPLKWVLQWEKENMV